MNCVQFISYLASQINLETR